MMDDNQLPPLLSELLDAPPHFNNVAFGDLTPPNNYSQMKVVVGAGKPFKMPATGSPQSLLTHKFLNNKPTVVNNDLPSPETMKLEQALNVEPFVQVVVDSVGDTPVLGHESSDDESDILTCAEDEAAGKPIVKEMVKAFDRMKKCRRYIDRNFGADFEFDSEDEGFSIPEDQFQEMFRQHVKRKKMRITLRSLPDEVFKPKRQDDDRRKNLWTDDLDESTSSTVQAPERRGRKKSDKPLTVDQMNSRRRRLWVAIMKKEISKASKARNYNQKEKVANAKRVSTHCMRMVRQRAMQSERVMKETVWRAKRLTREMQAYWKRFDRVEKQQKRQQEKEEEQQRKMDVELLEAKRQQRKLNFLITQTELYAHFMAKKIGGTAEDEETILERLDEEKPVGRMAEIDDYDADEVKNVAMVNANRALDEHAERTAKFEVSLDSVELRMADAAENAGDRIQPDLFNGTLKAYQLKGMNWLMNLYDQGINGILADEMGLGKTVQALAMLSYIAEKYDVWGPFLVITPASTLHNWQQEVARFIPTFKVVPYWGSPSERKILRHFWDQTNLHTKSASFHIVITSYQLVVTDFKYFNRIKWQYLVLDEAQAIKSSSSQRWKMLLEFKCRNRLLLSGTPIQNSMAELWSLLHFVMPTLFDSHEEFKEWFSKDIESSAESGKTQVDEKQISRLHLILKPFMLRRIKKDVENELTDKVEVLVYCPLTIRQKLLYMGLKRKIKIEDLLQGLGSQSQNSALTSSLMNLVMQFRKVCNHPELFERREARSPFAMNIGPYRMPKLLFNERIPSDPFSFKQHLLYNKLSVFNPLHVHKSLWNTNEERLEVSSSPFSYLRFVDVSPGEQYEMFLSLLARWLHIAQQIRTIRHREHHRRTWWASKKRLLGRRALQVSLIDDVSSNASTSPALSSLVFVRTTADSVFAHHDITIRSMPETINHRLIRTKHSLNADVTALWNKLDADDIHQQLLPEIRHVSRPDRVLTCQPCHVPEFLFDTCPRVATPGRLPYVSDSTARWTIKDHEMCSSEEGREAVKFGSTEAADELRTFQKSHFRSVEEGGLYASRTKHGWSNIVIPDKQTLVSDAGKLYVLDGLLARLKEEGHRVLIYSQMTKMIDLLEEYMWHRKHTFMRLDGSSKIHERRDMVADFQQRSDIFVFLLSTRAGGLGINLTAADTVIFYDSDWNPTVDQQAMDRAHRLGQTKQVTVYRLICKGTIEERILQRAREKSEIQRMVIQGGSFKGKQGELKPKEVVSLLLDDDEIERKYKIKAEEKKQEELKREAEPEVNTHAPAAKKIKLDLDEMDDLSEDSNGLMIDVDSSTPNSREPTRPPSPLFDFLGEKLGPKRPKRGTGRRGRPRGSGKRGGHAEAANSIPQDNGEHAAAAGRSQPAKRGPGRPRLKPGGPLNQGSRGPPKQAKPAKLKSKGLPAALAATLSAKYKASPPQGPKFYNSTDT